jgi:nitroreductase
MANQELYEAILNRRSVRKYLDKPIGQDMLKALILAGMYAPSAMNQQPWRFLAMTDKEKLKELHGKIPQWAVLDEAAAAIVIVADLSLVITPQRNYFIEDCGACAQNILLAAHALGLGAVWLGTHPVPEREAHARKVLGIADNAALVPFCVISLGYPAQTPKNPKRWDESRVHWDRWE